jgi:hypothetical protein
MAGLEVVVRPVVFPNIRPQAPRVLPALDDPTKGICTIGGGSGNVIDLPHSWSVSLSHSEPVKEQKRQVDKERHYQVDENGNVKKKNFIDVNRLKKVQLAGAVRDGLQTKYNLKFSDPPPPEVEGSVEVLEANKDIITDS